ncbi:MAG: DUF2812 domain-containing protein [Pleomorphochaeta sp.]
MIKFRLLFDKDVEVAWLNEMSNNGWAFTKFILGFYKFEKCEESEYVYDIDLLSYYYDYDNFKTFMKESDIEVVQRWYRWVYVRKINDYKGFELYSDTESKIEHYQRILSLFKVAFIIELVCFLFEIGIPLITREMTAFNFIAISLIVLFAICVFGAYSKTQEKLKYYKNILET